MKNFSAVSLAIAAALVISPVALVGQTHNFNFSGPVTNGPNGAVGEITINGAFATSTPYGPDGGVIISSFSGYYSDTGDGVSGAISLYPGYGTYENYLTSADDSWWFNNLFYPGANAPGTTRGLVDYYGPLFYVSPTTGTPDPDEWEVNFWAVTNTTYQVEESVTGSTQHFLNYASGIGITSVNEGTVNRNTLSIPEGGAALLYLLLAGAACFGAMVLSPRNRLGNRASA